VENIEDDDFICVPINNLDHDTVTINRIKDGDEVIHSRSRVNMQFNDGCSDTENMNNYNSDVPRSGLTGSMGHGEGAIHSS
jgi:hypothetical protein